MKQYLRFLSDLLSRAPNFEKFKFAYGAFRDHYAWDKAKDAMFYVAGGALWVVYNDCRNGYPSPACFPTKFSSENSLFRPPNTNTQVGNGLGLVQSYIVCYK